MLALVTYLAPLNLIEGYQRIILIIPVMFASFVWGKPHGSKLAALLGIGQRASRYRLIPAGQTQVPANYIASFTPFHLL